MLLVVRAINIVAMNSWYMLWYKRSCRADTRPCSASTRMYGRENSDVVNPTNAVNVTRNTLKASMKNCSRATNRFP